MSADEARRLLGGYATGTLTPEEQRALFEAALNNQELFNALQREEVLREALVDADTRAGLLRTLQTGPPRRRFGLGAWAAAASAIAAGITVVLLLRTQPKPPAENQQIAEVRREKQNPEPALKGAPSVIQPEPTRPHTQARRRQVQPKPAGTRHPLEEAPASPAAAPASAAPPAPAAKSGGFDAAVAEPKQKMAALRSAAASLPYTVEKQGADGSFEASSASAVQPGDAVRIGVQVPGSGVLTLENVTDAGPPSVLASLPVDAGSRVTIPDSGIAVTAHQRLRLTFRPRLAGAVGGAMPANGLTQAAPVTVEIVLAPR